MKPALGEPAWRRARRCEPAHSQELLLSRQNRLDQWFGPDVLRLTPTPGHQ